jgi:uncharacterized membrane protein
MKQYTLKAIGMGILIGSIAYFAPGVLLFMLLFFGLMSLFGRKRYRKYREYQMVYAEKVRNMSDEEFATHQKEIKEYKRCC